MKITPINKENLEYFKEFINGTDVTRIEKNMKILPLGLVADDLQGGKNMAAGAICLYPDEYELEITSFFVSPEYRGRGAGKFLLDESKRIFGKKDMEFDIEFLLYGKEEENLALFLEHYGFTYADPEDEVMEIMVVDLEKTKLNDKEGEGEPFASISKQILSAAEKDAQSQDAVLPAGGLMSENIEKDISIGMVREGKLESYLVFEKVSKGILLLSALYTKDNNPTTSLHMMEAATNRILDKYPGYVKIIIQPVNEKAMRMITNVYDEAKIISCRYRYVI